MIDAKTLMILEHILQRESLSFLQYVNESAPWTTTAQKETLNRLEAIIAEERQATAGLSRFLAQRHHDLPYIGSYPASFTSFGFISLNHLLPILAQAQRQTIVELEQDISVIHDADAKEQVRRILEMKRRHLGVLTEQA